MITVSSEDAISGADYNDNNNNNTCHVFLQGCLFSNSDAINKGPVHKMRNKG